jgi:hypothetical protein
MWWLYCHAVFSGLANFIAIGMITSRSLRAMGPAALWLFVRAASLIMRVTRSSRRSSRGMHGYTEDHDGPLHPYGMQRLIKRWREDEVINVGQRATL